MAARKETRKIIIKEPYWKENAGFTKHADKEEKSL
jgi:hypothetical protein